MSWGFCWPHTLSFPNDTQNANCFAPQEYDLALLLTTLTMAQTTHAFVVCNATLLTRT